MSEYLSAKWAKLPVKTKRELLRRAGGDQKRLAEMVERIPTSILEKQHLKQPSTPEPDTLKRAVQKQEQANKKEDRIAKATIPGFQIIKELGKGAMGAVYLATDERLRRRVAIKTALYPDSELEALLEREQQVQASLDHQNIAPIFQSGTFRNEEGQELAYYAMRAIPGTTLKEATKQEELDFSRHERIEAVAKIADAIAYAHKKRIIHRDLKPENVMIGPDGLFVMDFGLAKQTEDLSRSIAAAVTEGAQFSQPGEIKGTPTYMAPEQADGRATYKSDVYALGEILYESLTGLKFRQGKFASLMELLISIKQGLAGSDEGYALLEPEIRSIVKSATAYDPEDRPSASQVADNLRAYLRGEEVELHAYTFRERTERLLKKHGGKAAAGLLAATLGLAGAATGMSLKAKAEKAEKEKAIAAERALRAEEKARHSRIDTYIEQLEVKIQNKNWEEAYGLYERIKGAGFEDEERLKEWEKTIGGWTPVKIEAPEGFEYAVRKIGESNSQKFTGDAEFQLTPGPYLLEGEDDYRDLLLVKRGQPLEDRIELAETLDGFVWIPSGETTVQRKPFGKREIVEIPGFYLAKKHVTFGEYFDFLKSSELRDGKLNHVFTAAGISEAQIPKVLPMLQPTLMMPGHGNVKFDENEIIKLELRKEHPAAGITILGAELYTQWMNLKSNGIRYSLPTEKQVRRAYGELTGQRFPWGNEVNRKIMITAEEMNNAGYFGNILLIENGQVPESWAGIRLGNIRDAIKSGNLYGVYGIGIRPGRENHAEHPMEVSTMNLLYPNSTMGMRVAAKRDN